MDVLTDGFAFRLLLTTERDAAMQQKALQLSEWAPGRAGLRPWIRAVVWLTRLCVPCFSSSCLAVPSTLNSLCAWLRGCAGGEARLPAEEDMQLRTWHQGAISGEPARSLALPPG